MAEDSNSNKIAKCAEELKSILADQKIDFSHLETPKDVCEFGTKFCMLVELFWDYYY
jgi:hypothetical protein